MVVQKKKYNVTLKLMGHEWHMLTDEPAMTGKFFSFSAVRFGISEFLAYLCEKYR